MVCVVFMCIIYIGGRCGGGKIGIWKDEWCRQFLFVGVFFLMEVSTDAVALGD